MCQYHALGLSQIEGRKTSDQTLNRTRSHMIVKTPAAHKSFQRKCLIWRFPSMQQWSFRWPTNCHCWNNTLGQDCFLEATVKNIKRLYRITVIISVFTKTLLITSFRIYSLKLQLSCSCADSNDICQFQFRFCWYWLKVGINLWNKTSLVLKSACLSCIVAWQKKVKRKVPRRPIPWTGNLCLICCDEKRAMMIITKFRRNPLHTCLSYIMFHVFTTIISDSSRVTEQNLNLP